MPTTTTNFSLKKPLVNDAIDEDLWGAQLNTNMDTIDERLTPTGGVIAYAGITAPNADWLLCDGSAVSRTTYATLFALVSTSFGVGDGSTTFNLPDIKGRNIIGLDNMGGSSANRITDSNADSLNNTGGGDEDDTSTISGSVTEHTLTAAQIPDLTYTIKTDGSGTGFSNSIATGDINQPDKDVTGKVTTNAGGGSHPHSDTFAISGTGKNTQPWVALGAIIKT